MVVAAAILSDSNGNIFAALSRKYASMDANIWEAFVASLAIILASSFGYSSLILDGDSLTIISMINNASSFLDWNFSSIIGDILQQLECFRIWTATKVSCNIFGSIPITYPFLSVVRINSEKDPSM
jgi:hypothetical protein